MTTTITLKGQITIPKQIRDALGLVPGMQLDFAVNHEGEVVLQKKSLKKDKNQIVSLLFAAKLISNGELRT